MVLRLAKGGEDGFERRAGRQLRVLAGPTTYVRPNNAEAGSCSLDERLMTGFVGFYFVYPKCIFEKDQSPQRLW